MRMTLFAGALALGLITGFVDRTRADEPLKVQQQPMVTIVGEAEFEAAEVFLVEGTEGAEATLVVGEGSNFWIGLSCRPADATLMSQLNLKQGLVVDHVAPDSPAAKAGLAVHDVLTKIGDTELNDLPTLMKAVEAAQEKEQSIEYYRGGKLQSGTVKPMKRPAGARFEIREARTRPAPGFQAVPAVPGIPAVPGVPVPGPGGARFQFIHPGVVMPPPAAFPKDLKVLISREGEGPAKIVVKQGDKSWDITEKELDKLPPELRPHVERMLGRGDVIFGHAGTVGPGGHFQIELAPAARLHAIPGVPGAPVPAGPLVVTRPALVAQPQVIEYRAIETTPAIPGDVQKKLDEVNRKLDEILKRLDAGK